MTNLMQAANQWCNRPADERYGTLTDMLSDANEQANRSVEGECGWENIRIAPYGDEGLVMEGKSANAAFSNYAMNQLLRNLDYPGSAIMDRAGKARIPSSLAADVLNHRINKMSEENSDRRLKLYVDANENVNTIRAVTSDSYGRVEDRTLIPEMIKLTNNGWRVPPARPVEESQPGSRIATEEDIIALSSMNGGGIQVKVGDIIAPAGLYRGDRDMFVFLVNENNSVDDGKGNALFQGVFITNSEVGARSFCITQFLMQAVCGNHIVWGAEQVTNIRYRHSGDNVLRKCLEALTNLNNLGRADLTRYVPIMDWMRMHQLGRGKAEVTDAAYKLLNKDISLRALESAYDTCVMHEESDGDPNTFMGVANGLTRFSQTVKNQDDRLKIDTVVGGLFNHAKEMMSV